MTDSARQVEVLTVRGICPHGKVRFMAVDEPEIIDAKVRKEIGQMVAAGYTIDRVSVEVARKSDMRCEPCEEIREQRRKNKRSKSGAEGLLTDLYPNEEKGRGRDCQMQRLRQD